MVELLTWHPTFVEPAMVPASDTSEHGMKYDQISFAGAHYELRLSDENRRDLIRYFRDRVLESAEPHPTRRPSENRVEEVAWEMTDHFLSGLKSVLSRLRADDPCADLPSAPELFSSEEALQCLCKTERHFLVPASLR
jgi:hypothetical protein